ncbi:PLD nuclease N-terminal domain-containing protein [Streptomyces flavofungini]|uniref:PLD nuclease N-terminal domain-containing protein n=1 Tax=Streptomyces flavofungini TaxID=68200 RepID=UPI0034DFB7AE
MERMHALHESRTTLAATGHQVLGYGLAAVIVVLILAYVALFIGALISIVASPLSRGMKLVWVVFAFAAPFIGSLLWFLIGRRELRRGAATPSYR